jgi:hypothetical protein
LLRIGEAGLYGVAAEGIDEALRPIVKVSLVEFGGDPGSEKNRWAAFVDPVVENLDRVEATLDEHRNCGVYVVRIAKTKIRLHSLQGHGFGFLVHTAKRSAGLFSLAFDG